jgi:hypothetical protein
LNAALASISDTLATCSFGLEGLPDDAEDHAAKDGWDWMDKAQTSIELFGDARQAFKTNRKTSVIVEFGCEPIVVF